MPISRELCLMVSFLKRVNPLQWRPTRGNVFLTESRDQSPSSPPQKDQACHKSDIFLERPQPPSSGTFLDFQPSSPYRQVRMRKGG